MKYYFNNNDPCVESLRKKATLRLPKFAFEYVDGGCNNEIGLKNNYNKSCNKFAVKNHKTCQNI